MFTSTRPHVIVGKMKFGEQVNILEKYCKGEISYTFTRCVSIYTYIKTLFSIKPTPRIAFHVHR